MTSSTEASRAAELVAARHLERHAAPRRACAWRARCAARWSARARGRRARSRRWSGRRAGAASARPAPRCDSTGWQAMKTRRSRSSPMSSSSAASRSSAGSSLLRLELAAELLVLALEQLARGAGGRWRGAWRWPSARRPGCRARPTRGQRSSAATSASCASSSARPTSRTMRARPAMSRADSMRQTASIARWVSAAATAADHTTPVARPQARARRRDARPLGRYRRAPRAASPRTPPPPPARRRGSRSSPAPGGPRSISFSEAGQRFAHSMASSFDFTSIIQ